MDILLTHGYYLSADAAERRVMKPYPPLGILYLSAHLKSSGFQVGVFDSTFASIAAFADRLARDQPAVVGIYGTLMTRGGVVEMTRLAKQAGATVVLGGPEPINHAQQYFERGADVIVAGEGELVVERLLRHLPECGLDGLDEIPGLAFRGPEGSVTRTQAATTVQDLDSLPHPDRAAIDLRAYVDCWRMHHGRGSLSLVTARGCPYTCTWCSHSVYGFTHRRRSPENVADELEALMADYQPDMVWYADDVFTINHRWLFSYAAELERRGLRVPFETISREDRLDEPVIRTLASMGCYRLWVGAESGSQRVLDAMKRGTNAGRTREMIRLLQRHGIEAGTFIMLGYEGETLLDIEATLEHLKAAPPDSLLTTTAYPIEGTEYARQVADRAIVQEPWEARTDRDVTVAGRRSRQFYQFASRWIVNEVALHKQRQEAAPGYLQMVRTLTNAKLGRLGMLLTQHAVDTRRS